MEQFILRVAISPEYNYKLLIFGLGHYISKNEGEDQFSKDLIYFYKYGNKEDYFRKKLNDLINLRLMGDSIKFDLITLYPTRHKGCYNENMDELVQNLSSDFAIPYKKILRRNRDIKPSHKISTFAERVENIKNSVDVTEKIDGKNIILVDNISTTGISLIDAANLLFEKGAKEVVGLCLGLSAKEKEKDWCDVNKTLKYSRIKTICKTPFVKEEDRKKWKEGQKNS
ncbi:MAG: ComF family protein [bacterium]